MTHMTALLLERILHVVIAMQESALALEISLLPLSPKRATATATTPATTPMRMVVEPPPPASALLPATYAFGCMRELRWGDMSTQQHPLSKCHADHDVQGVPSTSEHTCKATSGLHRSFVVRCSGMMGARAHVVPGSASAHLYCKDV
jgi:hypothetical protein